MESAARRIPCNVPVGVMASGSIRQCSTLGRSLARARASGLPCVLHCLIDPEAITPTGTLQGIRQAALAKQ